MARETAEQAYNRNMKDVEAMLKTISAELSKQKATLQNGQLANWGNVGDVAYIKERIKDVHDQLTNTGEYAE